MCRMRFCGNTKRFFSKTCELEAYDENVCNAILWKHKNRNFKIMWTRSIWRKCAECDYVETQKDSFRKHVNSKHMTKMYRMRFCGNTKIEISKSCELEAYGGNVPNVIMWKHKKILFENMWTRSIWRKCPECDFTVKQKDSFQNHVKTMHMTEMLFCGGQKEPHLHHMMH